ncbi:MAG: amidohydrolase, partial [Candidatus Aminicenantes bacterium]|nr:amidohydrolase [Candidatus Aminicenantes bacterium]
MKGFPIFVLALFFMLGVSCQTDSKREIADVVLLNGFIWTVNPDMPRAEAVALKGEKILKVESTSEIKRMVGDKTKVIDLKGAFVLPGFTDCHTHFLDGGFSLSSVQLREAQAKEDFVARIEQKTKELEKGEWILNGNWDHQQFDPPELPRKEWIDAVTPDNPVCVNRLDGHMALVNSLALKLAGITKDTPAPAGGEIVKDPQTGEPTGILKDEAMDLVTSQIPEPTLKERMRAAELALKHANEVGVTSIHDMAYASSFEVYQRLLKQNTLSARLYVYIPISEIKLLTGLKLVSPFGNDFLKIAGLKGFVDGSLGSSTALFFDPYTDEPAKRGLLVSDMFPEGIMEERLMEADQAGLQVAIHAIGDKANNMILDIFETVMSASEDRDRRWRIEHVQHLLLDDVGRMGRLRVIASVQPYHAVDDGRWAEKKIGKERARHTYAFRSLLDGGVTLACGSDWPVAPLNPLTGICAAVTRQTLDGKNPDGWIPDQKITLEEAIKGYTMSAAFTEFAEKGKGSV